MTATAVVAIDMQKALLSGAYREAETLAVANEVIDSAHQAGAPVVFVQHNHASFAPMARGAPGWALHPDLHRAAQDMVVEKTACDAFFETGLAARLIELGVSSILVMGLQTEYCVDTTCRTALSLGFDVTLVADGHTTGDGRLPAADIVAHHNATLDNLVHPSSKVAVTPAAEICFEAKG